MDLDTLITQENSDEGIWTQAIVYGKKQDFDIKILGADSDKVQIFNRDRLKKIKLNTKQGVDLDDDVIDEILDNGNDDVVVRMAGLKSRDKNPLTLQGKELTSDISSYRLLIEKVPALKEFILKFSNERLNFLSKKKRD